MAPEIPPAFPPQWEQWAPAPFPAPPIPVWLYNVVKDMIPFGAGARSRKVTVRVA